MKCSVGESGQTRRSEGTNPFDLLGGREQAGVLVGSVTWAIIRIGKSRAAKGPLAMLKSVLAGAAILVRANSLKGATSCPANSHHDDPWTH